MPKGGARMRSGPTPDPNALKRQRDSATWTKLSAEGRGGRPAPEWPLPDTSDAAAILTWLGEKIAATRTEWGEAQDSREAAKIGRALDKLEREHAVLAARVAARHEQELAMWDQLWRQPQAVVWEADAAEIQVAMYVRILLESSRPEAKAADRTLQRQMADSLLLTTPALHSMKYVIDEAIDGASRPDLTGEAAAAPAKVVRPNRFRVVRGEGAAEAADDDAAVDQQTTDEDEDDA